MPRPTPLWSPIGRDGLALLREDADLAVGRLPEGNVEHEVAHLAAGNGDGQRIDADDLVAPAPWRHGRQRVGAGEADHPGLQRHAGIKLHRAGVVGTGDGGEGDVDVAGALDRLFHSERHGDGTEVVGAIDDEGGDGVGDDARLALGIDAFLGQLLYIVGHAQDAVGMNAARVGVDQRARYGAGGNLVHAAGLEDR